MPFIESFQEFSKRHGDDAIEVGARLIFGDGAIANSEDGKVKAEPPESQYELLLVIKMRAKELLRRAELEFFNARSTLSEMAANAIRYSNLPGPPSDAPQQLRKLKSNAIKRRKELAAIDAKLEKTPQRIARRKQEQQLAERQQQITEVATKINQITLNGEEQDDADPMAFAKDLIRQEKQMLSGIMLQQAGIKPPKNV